MQITAPETSFSLDYRDKTNEYIACIELLRTLQSDKGDVNENVTEKRTPHPFFFAIIPKEGNLMFEQKRWSRAQVQTEMVEFIALPFPSSKKNKIKNVCHFTS